MGNEKLGKECLTTPSQRRRRLSNITNLSLSANWSNHTREDSLLKSCSKSSDFQLQQATMNVRSKDTLTSVAKRQENIQLKKLLAEKEEALEAQAESLEQMQKEFLIQLRRQSQVNEEIINFNSRLSKEGGQLRDQCKLLQHEYCQMTAAYRIQVNELQLKLTETQEQLKKLLEEQESKRSTPTSHEPPQVPRKSRSHLHRRHSTAGSMLDTDWNHSTKLIPEREETVSRPEVRRRSGKVVVKKEAVPKLKLNPQPPPGSIRHINRYSDLIGLEPMVEVSEEEYSPCNSTDTTSSSPRNENFSRSVLTSESNSNRTDDATACSLSTRCSEVSASSSKGLQPLKTNKVNLVAPELQKPINSSSAPHFSRRVYNTLVSGTGGGSRRPVRKAVENVASYREPPLNTKMRRPS